jgi:hypothetical protein
MVFAELPKTMAQIKTQLEYLGYTVEYKDTYAVARKSAAAVITVKLYKQNILMYAYYDLDMNQGTRYELYEAVNLLNQNASVCRYYVDDDDDLMIEMVISDIYDRTILGNFLTLWQAESYTALADPSAPIYPFVP